MNKPELRLIEGSKTEEPAASESEAAPEGERKRRHGAQERWTEQLGRYFTPVSDYFLANYHRLRPHPNARGLNSAEAMLIIQLMSFKRDRRAPFPSHKTLAERMGMSERMVRQHVRALVTQGYLQCERKTAGGVNRYHLEPLFAALEKMMAEDVSRPEQEAS